MAARIKVTVLERQLDGSWLLAFTAASASDFHDVLDQIKKVPIRMRQWRPETKCWWFSVLGMERLRGLLPEVNDAIDGRLGEASVNRRSPQIPPEVINAFATLHLLPTAPLPVVKATFRALAAIHHPDHGGTHEMMLRLNSAYTTAYAWAEQWKAGQRYGDSEFRQAR